MTTDPRLSKHVWTEHSGPDPPRVALDSRSGAGLPPWVGVTDRKGQRSLLPDLCCRFIMRLPHTRHQTGCFGNSHVTHCTGVETEAAARPGPRGGWGGAQGREPSWLGAPPPFGKKRLQVRGVSEPQPVLAQYFSKGRLKW